MADRDGEKKPQCICSIIVDFAFVLSFDVGILRKYLLSNNQ